MNRLKVPAISLIMVLIHMTPLVDVDILDYESGGSTLIFEIR